MTDNGTPANNQQTPPVQVTPPANNGGEAEWTKERSAQAKRAGQRELFTPIKDHIGISDEDLKTPDGLKKAAEKLAGIVAEYKILKGEKLTDSERTAAQLQEMQNALATAQNERTAAVERAAQLEAERIKDKTEGALKEAARGAKATDVDDVLMWAEKNAPEDLTKLVGEDGKVNVTAVETLVKKVQTAKPSWFGAGGPGSPSNRGGKTPDPKSQMQEALKGKKLFGL